MVDFEPIGEVSNTGSAFVCMCDNYHLVSPIDEFLPFLVSNMHDSGGTKYVRWIIDICDSQSHLHNVSKEYNSHNTHFTYLAAGRRSR
jgi:hypothetical protein